MFRFTCRQSVRWKDVDAAGIVNNAVYLTLVEHSRYLYFTQLGILSDEHVPFVLAETTAAFLSPGRVGMDLEVAARVARLGNKSFDMEYEIRHESTPIVKIRAVLVTVDATLSSCEIPADFRRRVAEFENIPERS